MPRKRRTRGHIIADLAVNYVGRQMLLAGHTIERFWHDYGVDLMMNTYNDAGEYENGSILLQVRATDMLRLVDNRAMVAVRIETAHFRQWISEPMPFILVAYDAESEVAYWLHLQPYFAESGRDVRQLGKMLTVRIPIDHVFDVTAIRHLVALKNERVAARERRTHNETK